MIENTTATAAQLSSQNSTLIAVVVVNIVIFGLLIAYILFQSRKINRLEEAAKPRYGFLGKPLFSLIALSLMIGSFSLTYVISKGTPDYSVGDETKVKLEIKAEIIEQIDGYTTARFQVVPTVEDLQWGGTDRNKFDAFWSVKGEENFSEIESDISLASPGGFQRTLPSGIYEVRVDVIFKGLTWTLERTVQL